MQKKTKVIPPVKVEKIPSLDKITWEDKMIYGMIMSNGKSNYYRIEFAKGRGGSYKEETWSRKKHWHNCCKSKVPWRHKTACPKLDTE